MNNEDKTDVWFMVKIKIITSKKHRDIIAGAFLNVKCKMKGKVFYRVFGL